MMTTNRPTCSRRPWPRGRGRVDVAVEIAMPDAPARSRLLTITAQNVPAQAHGEDVDLGDEHAPRTPRVVLKKLIRRAVLESLQATNRRSPT